MNLGNTVRKKRTTIRVAKTKALISCALLSQILSLWHFPVNYSKEKLKQTRIVRGSDYSPASELFARVRKTMTGINPKLDLVNVDAHKKICKILSICSQGIERKRNSHINQGQRLCQNFAKNDGQQSQARSCQC